MDCKTVVLCVNYRCEAATEAFLRALQEMDGAERIWAAVADNSAPGAGSPLADRLARFERLVVTPQPDNPGYFPGAARALAAFLKRRPLPEWTVVSNTDIAFPDRRFFVRLWAGASKRPPCLLAPRILSARSGGDQNPFAVRRPRRAGLWLRAAAFHHPALFAVWRFASRVKQRLRSRHPPRAAAREPSRIFAPHGAFVVLHRAYFERGGRLDLGTPLFGEELCLGEAARRLHLPVVYDPRLVVEHEEHAISGSLSLRRRREALRQSAMHVLRVFARSDGVRREAA